MLRCSLIFAMLLAPLQPMRVRAEMRGASTSQSASCCCCKAGTCRCGCEKPATPSDRGKNSQRNRFCNCGDVPMGMPDQTIRAPERVELLGTIQAADSFAPDENRPASYHDHRPHGPPYASQLIDSIILLI